MVCRPGASRNSRASPSDSRSPRFEVTSACSSSSITRFSVPNRYGASAEASSSASCSGVVSRMSGGSRRWRVRFDTGVSPVRVSIRIGRAHLGDRGFEIARDVDRERLQRRDVERVQALRAAKRRGRSRPVCLRQAPRCCSLNSTSVGRKPASVLPPPVGAISSTELSVARTLQQIRADARAASSRARRTSARTRPASRAGEGRCGIRASEPRPSTLAPLRQWRSGRAPPSPAIRAPERRPPCGSRPAQACESSARQLQARPHMRLAVRVAQLRAEDDAAVVMGLDREGKQTFRREHVCRPATRSA